MRSRYRGWVGVLTLAVLAVASSSGCTAARDRATISARSPKPLRLADSYTFRSLNPLYNDGFNASELDALLFSLMFHTGPDGRLVPEAATTVPSVANGGIARDGRAMTYHLRHDLRWSDGRPLTAADVLFTVRAIRDPRTNVGSRVPYTEITAVEMPDPYTVRLRLARANTAMVGLFLTDDSNYPILPAHALAHAADINRDPFGELPVGSGPYRVRRWDRGRAIELEANPFYYGGKPALARIDLRETPDSTTELVQLKTGEIDGILHADVSQAAQLAAIAGHHVTNVPYIGAAIVMFQTKRSPLDDVRVRRAIAASIDRPRLAANTYHGYVTTDDALRGVFSYASDPNIAQIAYDPVAAGRLFDVAGWRRGASGVRERDGVKLELTAIYYTNTPAWRVIAATLQHELGRAGVALSLKGYAYSQFWSRLADGGPLAKGDFDLALTSISTDVDPDVSWLLRCNEAQPHGSNAMRYCDPAVDAALGAALAALDPAARTRAVRRVQRLIARDVPILALWQTRELDIVPDDLRGFTPNGTFPFDSAHRWSRDGK